MRARVTPTAARRLPHHTSCAGGGRTLDSSEDAALVQHHVHPSLVPEGCEDLAADAERWAAVMILLDRLGQGERERPGLVGGDGHGRNVRSGECTAT